MLRNEYYNCDSSYLHIGYSSSYNWVTSIFCLFHNPHRRPREGILEMNLCTLCREAEHLCLLVLFFKIYKETQTYIYLFYN